MSAPEWKPGDVAIDGGGNRLMCSERVDGSLVWMNVFGGFYPIDGLIEDARPLVVIDPEDREQVERFIRALDVTTGHRSESIPPVRLDNFATALREFANPTPPRIDEPNVWGVVEASCVHSDTRCEWVRYPSGNWHTLHHSLGDLSNPDDWDSLVDPVLVRVGVMAHG